MADLTQLNLNGTDYNLKDTGAVHTVDSAMSSTSTNPVQNKVVQAAVVDAFKNHGYLISAGSGDKSLNWFYLGKIIREASAADGSWFTHALRVSYYKEATLRVFDIYELGITHSNTSLKGKSTCINGRSDVNNGLTFYYKHDATEKVWHLYGKIDSASSWSGIRVHSFISSPHNSVVENFSEASFLETAPTGVTAIDLAIQLVDTRMVDSTLSTTSTNPVQNKVVTAALNNKLDVVTGGYRTIPQDVSKGANLITNCSGTLLGNYNWSNCSFKADTDLPTGVAGCFHRAAYSEWNDEYLAVNTSKKYAIESWYRVKSESTSTVRLSLACFDIDKKSIEAINICYGVGTLTRLTQDLNPGDTVVHLEDLSNSNWKSSTTYHRGFIVWNYTNSAGYTYPAETYSRNVYPASGDTPLWSPENVDQENNTITLTNPWSYVKIPAGTYLSRRNSGSTYFYAAYTASAKASSTWSKLSGKCSGFTNPGTADGGAFRPGTAFVKVGWVNASTSGSEWFEFAGIEFREISESSETLLTARNLGVNLARTAASSFDGSANQLEIPVKGTLPIANGGTGSSNAVGALQNLAAGYTRATTNVTDSTDFLTSAMDSSGGFDGNARLYKRNVVYLWSYIKSKISSVLGLTSTNYGGTAAKASADASGNTITSTYATKSELTTGLSGKQDDISDLIPSGVSASNPLCDKAYADSIGERLEARYITADAVGTPFLTHAALENATEYYYHGQKLTKAIDDPTATITDRLPDTNDITLVIADEDHLNEAGGPSTTRYRYNGTDSSGKVNWSFEYIVNPTALNAGQLAAINSGINATKVDKLDGIEAEANKYVHPTFNAASAAAVKVGRNSEGHVVLGSALTKSDVGLGNVDNTSDANKPISTAMQAALDGKLDVVIQQTSQTANDYDSFTTQGVYNLWSSGSSNNYPETGRSTLVVYVTGTYRVQVNYGDSMRYRVQQAGSSTWSSWATVFSKEKDNVFKSGASAVGSTSQPVYVTASGEAKQCLSVDADTVDGLHIAAPGLSAGATIYIY